MVSIRAEKDLTKIVLGEERETTQRDRTLIIGGSFAQNVKELDTLAVGAVHSVQMGAFTKAETVAPAPGTMPTMMPVRVPRSRVHLTRTISARRGSAVLKRPGLPASPAASLLKPVFRRVSTSPMP